jgi:hypothetical protein
MSITAYWDRAPCSLFEVDRQFKGACCLHHQGDERDIDGGSMHSETSVYFNKPTRRYIPEDYSLHTHRCENLKSRKQGNVHFFQRTFVFMQKITASFDTHMDLHTSDLKGCVGK